MNRKRKSQSRPTIPQLTILKLWALAAGRCEFYGCNKELWRENLTMWELNNSHIAHIVAYSPDGPRGDIVLSKKLSNKFSNLMLVCRDHHNVIDYKIHENDYPVALLQSYKQMHENRISQQTSVQDDVKTTILLFKANVGDRKVNFPVDSLDRAIKPRYSDAKSAVIDLTAFNETGESRFWDIMQEEISTQVNQTLRPSIQQDKVKHLSLFAIGPMPLLIHLGNSIGNLIPVDLYQFHRDTQDWSWKNVKKAENFVVSKPQKITNGDKVALVLSLSGKIHASEVRKALEKGVPVYEISIKCPVPTFLNTKQVLDRFQKTYRGLLNDIRRRHPSVKEIHLFPAVPAPVAVACGKGLLPKIDPSLKVYEYNKQRDGFRPTLSVN